MWWSHLRPQHGAEVSAIVAEPSVFRNPGKQRISTSRVLHSLVHPRSAPLPPFVDWRSPAPRAPRHTRLISATAVAEGTQPHRVLCTPPPFTTLYYNHVVVRSNSHDSTREVRLSEPTKRRETGLHIAIFGKGGIITNHKTNRAMGAGRADV